MRLRLALALLAFVAVLAGCSAIPTETLPQPANIGSGQDSQVSVAQPPAGLSAPDIVRGFVNSSADSSNFYAAAQAYLTGSARSTWNYRGSITVIADNFSTIGEFTKDNKQETVTLRAQELGVLDGNNAFQADSTPIERTLRVNQQSDGQWRISYSPDGVVVPITMFQQYYRPVPVYFFDPGFSELVPDLRWATNDPASGMPARIVDLLLDGPSSAVQSALQSAIPGGVMPKTNVTEADDGAIVVNLENLPSEEPNHTKMLIVAQIVSSLHAITDGVVRIQDEGVALVPGHLDWRYSELAVSSVPSPSANLPGLEVARGRVFSLKDGSPISGPAGTGSYDAVTAAQSVDGTELAVVAQRADGSVELRVGKFGSAADGVDLSAHTMTRPTWAPADATGDPSREVWTVTDQQQVVRVDTTLAGWQATPVDSSELAGDGPITDLRLSRDGTRVAVIAGGHLYVGAVVTSEQGSVAIKQVSELQADAITSATSVDWLDQNDDLVVGTSQPRMPVARVSVDGFKLEQYAPANLTAPVTSVTGAPNRPVIVADATGLWQTSDITEVWQPQAHSQSPDAIAFYPG
ncbi:MAG TPA: LpqB family beta-propeller domain-containing protein [Pseudonocardiaceae bacterium]|nr:LpqB family beta-propeller domain-containing protein [Pseudonocardiaceae bacterium]